MDAHGEIDLPSACWINTALRWERHARLSARWLRIEAEAMSPGDRLSYSREVARASSERDKAIMQLRLPEKDANPWSQLVIATDSACDVPEYPSVHSAPSAGNALEGTTEAHNDG